MAPETLDAAAIASIRLLLGATAEQLAASRITDDLIGGRAERTVLARVGAPAYTMRPEPERAAIRRAVAFETAALLVDTMRTGNATTSERFSQQYSVTRQAVDLDAWAADLRARGREEVVLLIVPSSAPARSHFRAAPGRRGA